MRYSLSVRSAYNKGSFGGSLRRLTLVDRIALGIALLYAAVWASRIVGREPPLARYVAFLFFLSLGYLIFRIGGWTRTRLLWSLRNRLIIAYIFIAVVPVVMLLVLGALSARILYSQLGAYLFYEDMHRRVEEVADAADTVASAATMFAPDAAHVPRTPNQLPSALEAHMVTLEADLPGLEFDLQADGRFIQESGGQRSGRFEGLVQVNDGLWVVGEVVRGRAVVRARAPVTRAMLEGVAKFLGPVQVFVTRPAAPSDSSASLLHIGSGQYTISDKIETHERVLPPATAWYDFKVDGVSKLDSLLEDSVAHRLVPSPLLVNYSARLVPLNQRIFTSLGELSGPYIELFLLVLLVFLILEAGALVTGIVLTRTITRSVADLYDATQYVRAGDFSHRIRIERADQLGSLGESFNAMSASIHTLVEEQRKRQRLENEISIAHEVQAQLFPRKLPAIPGVEIGAFCKPARGVSGDYYDFLQLGPTQLAIALADISGKGISAALLMASVQAALRSQILLDGRAAAGAAAIVSGINRHLYLNTTEDRFATFFFAIYDSATRILHYTNAGHLPPLCIHENTVTRLETGGTVIGVFEDTSYEEGVAELKPGTVFVAFSDGLIEPENVYGEEFGTSRLQAVALRNRNASVSALVSALLDAPEEWAGSAEQADDMTVIVARMH
jgi:sigma-B regulation protein RsbU (phosphoserine phosphatase)